MAYYSRKMLSAEQNYDITNKELLIIIAALEEWHIYIKGAVKTIIYTDHRNLLSFTTMKKLNKQ